MRQALCSLAAALVLIGCATKPRLPLEGKELAARYAQVEKYYLANSKFRTDYDPPDAPINSDIIARNFVYVAQRSETQTFGEKILIQGEAIPLARWVGPVKLWSTGETAEDAEYLGNLLNRVSQLTNLSFTRTAAPQDANLHILIAGPNERSVMLDVLAKMGRLEDAPILRAWPHLPEYPCVARVYVNPVRHHIEWAIIFIKAELSGGFRRSCLTEEFVQSLGLFNDGDDIRPSIFNDDAEFIELTRHDEYLLRMLYDPRLQPGMTSETVEPIAREIALELLEGSKNLK